MQRQLHILVKINSATLYHNEYRQRVILVMTFFILLASQVLKIKCKLTPSEIFRFSGVISNFPTLLTNQTQFFFQFYTHLPICFPNTSYTEEIEI